MRWIKRLFCKHEYVFVTNYYGDVIIHNGWKRSAWECWRCGKYQRRNQLYELQPVKTWTNAMTDAESKDLAYWERNMLALRYAEGWYRDVQNNYPGWGRVLSLEGGRITFHIPDDFNVGNLPEIKPNWDGHTTEQKWWRIQQIRGVTP